MAALDFFSTSFDPLLALNTPGLRPPIPDAKPLITVQMCRPLLPDDHKDYKQPPAKPTTQPAPAPLPSQHQPAATATNPLTLFSTAARVPPPLSSAATTSRSASSVGPLALLQSLVATQQRCRVLLRLHQSLHSIVTGQLRAFDRHCNLYIVEAHERRRTTAQLTVSERQRRRSAKAADGDSGGSGVGDGEKLRWQWVEVQRVVGAWDSVWVGQMMVRGECVMSVSRCSDASEMADALITGFERDGDG